MRVENLWLGFRNSVIHLEAPPEQLQEMKLAFYGGATALYYEIIHMMDASEEPTDQDLAKMHEIDAELRSFKEKVKRQPRGGEHGK